MSESNFIERVIEAPAVALDTTVDSTRKISEFFTQHRFFKKATNYWRVLGPGLTTGAADDDPSGIATYSQAGAQYGFQLIWLAGFTFPLMAIVQEMCARIGLVTGRGLAANIRSYFPRWVLYTCTILLFGANSLNVGADLGAMAKATQLLTPQMSFGVLVLFFTLLSLSLQIFVSYKLFAKFLKWLALVLISYVITAFIIKLDWSVLLYHSFIPSIEFSKEQIFLICGILGTTISPYLFFWQTSQEVEEEILSGKTTLKARQEDTSKRDIRNMRLDVWSGMFLSNIVMYFIIATCAAILFVSGITTIESAEQAASALKPLAGENAYLLFTLGIIGTGLLTVPVLAGSASYALAESFRWKYGLYRKLKQAYSFYGVIIISMLIGLALNFVGIDPIKILIYTAVANGLVAPIILFCIIKISSDENVMGRWVNHPFVSFLGWVITGLMIIIGISTIYFIFIG